MQITIKSGKVTISDPCYEPDIWCAGVVENMKNGVYNCYGHMQEGRVAEISMVHVDTELLHNPVWEELEADIGVDSGQCGFFDHEYYNENGGDQRDTDEWAIGDDSFYGKACALTIGEPSQFGVFEEYAFVSSAGYGDGSYQAYTHETLEDDSEQIDAIKVVFIEDDADDKDGAEADADDWNVAEAA